MSKLLINYIKKEMSDELSIQYNSLVKFKGINKMTKQELVFLVWIKTGDIIPSCYTKKEIIKWITDESIFIEEIRDERLNLLLKK